MASNLSPRILKAYELEKHFGNILRNASADERKRLYITAYDEYFRILGPAPHQKEREERKAKGRVKLLKRFVAGNQSFADIGAGRCRLSLEIAKMVERCYAIDVYERIPDAVNVPKSFKFIQADAMSIPLPRDSVDVAFSDQLLEHLHPEDAYKHLNCVFRILREGGNYVIITPHSFSGPHDVSKHFDTKPMGFHLKEYTNTELSEILRRVGFSEVFAIIDLRGMVFGVIPIGFITRLETLLCILSPKTRRAVTSWRLFRGILGIKILATK